MTSESNYELKKDALAKKSTLRSSEIASHSLAMTLLRIFLQKLATWDKIKAKMGIRQNSYKNLGRPAKTNIKSISLTYSEATVQKNAIDGHILVQIKQSAFISADVLSAIAFMSISILILLGVAAGLYRWKKHSSHTPAPSEEHAEPTTDSQPILAPQEEYDIETDSLETMALNELSRARGFRKQGRISEYSAAISLAIKRYVGEKYHIKIVEASTSQILERLPQELTDSIFDNVGEILRTCDMISYWQHRSSRGELDYIYQIAVAFIQSHIIPQDADEDESEASNGMEGWLDS